MLATADAYPAVFSTRVLYTNGAGLVKDPLLARGFSRVEWHRDHFDEHVNQASMRFEKGRANDIHRNAVLEHTVKQVVLRRAGSRAHCRASRFVSVGARALSFHAAGAGVYAVQAGHRRPPRGEAHGLVGQTEPLPWDNFPGVESARSLRVSAGQRARLLDRAKPSQRGSDFAGLARQSAGYRYYRHEDY